MNKYDWVPLSIREGKRKFPQLNQEIPELHLKIFQEWIEEVLQNFFWGSEHEAIFTKFFMKNDVPEYEVYEEGLGYRRTLHGKERFQYHCKQSPFNTAEGIDYILYHLNKDEVSAELEKLDNFFIWANINWTVQTFPHLHLQRRVLPEVQEKYLYLAGSLDSKTPAAAMYLQKAWINAYGREPNAKEAWENSYLLVEEMLSGILAHKNIQGSSVGKYLGYFRENKKDKWNIHLPVSVNPRGRSPHSSTDQLVNLLELITHHYGRHPEDTRELTLKLARSQVNIALAIAQIIHDGNIEVDESMPK